MHQTDLTQSGMIQTDNKETKGFDIPCLYTMTIKNKPKMIIM